MASDFGLLCTICFEGLTPETCFKEPDGTKWDLCANGTCAQEAGWNGTNWPEDR